MSTRNPPPGNSFPKAERLVSRKLIEKLFGREGVDAQVRHPLLCKWMMSPRGEGASLSVAFSVPKKKFPRAVDRNLLKRRMREAWRLNRQDLKQAVEDSQLDFHCMVIYLDGEVKTYDVIEKAMGGLLKNLKRDVKKVGGLAAADLPSGI